MTWFGSYECESFGLVSSYISDYKVFTMLLIYWQKGQFFVFCFFKMYLLIFLASLGLTENKIIEINNIIYNIPFVYLEKIDFTSPCNCYKLSDLYKYFEIELVCPQH